MRSSTLLVLILAVAACSSPADSIGGPGDDEPATEPLVVFQSLHSGIEQEARFAIRSAAAWQAFWSELHTTGLDVDPTPPPVNFTSSMVVVAALGVRERAGHSVAIPAYQQEGGAVTATVLKTSPDPTCPASPVFTTPAAVAVLPAAPVVTFLELEQQATCPQS
jgi:hypothetical protein